MVIVLASPPAPSADVVARLKAWSRSLLLERFVWWPLEPGQDPGGDGAHTAEVVDALAGTSAGVQSLAEAFSGGADDGEAVLLVLVPDGVAPSQVAEAVARAREHLQVVVGFVEVPVLGLLAPPASGAKQVELGPVAGWDGLVVLAPEDCEVPGGANHLLEHPDLYAGHVAAAVATLGGLWRDADPARPPLGEVLDRLRARGQGQAQVVRCFTRHVDGGFLLDHVAAEALKPLDQWPLPRGQQYQRFDLDDEHRQYLRDVHHHAHEAVLDYRRIAPERPEGPLDLLEAVRRIVAWIRHELLHRPWRIVIRAAQRTFDAVMAFVERGLQRSDPGKTVKRWADIFGPAAAEDDDPTGPVAPRLTPEDAVAAVWGDLREIALGVMDGSDLPAYVTSEAFVEAHDRRIVVDPNQVVPDPRDTTPADVARLLGRPAPRSCDPDRTLPLLEELDGRIRWTTARLEHVGAALDRLAAAERAAAGATGPVSSVPDPAADVPAPDDPGADEEPAGSAPEQGEPGAAGADAQAASNGQVGDDVALDEGAALPEGKAELEAERERLRAQLARLHERRSALASWIQAASGSLLWGCAVRLRTTVVGLRAETARAEEAVRRAADPEAPDSPDVEAMQQERAKVRRRSRIRNLVQTAVAAAAGWFAVVRLDGWLQWVVVGAIGVLWAGLTVRTLRRTRRRRAALAQEVARLRTAEQRVDAYPQELERLEQRYREMVDWCEIIGWIVHRPWVGGAEGDVALPEPLDPAGLPRSFQAATAVVDADQLAAVVNRARRDLFAAGWLSGVYRSLAEVVEREVRRAMGTEDPAEVVLDPAADTSNDPEQPRLTMLAAARVGDQHSEQRSLALRRLRSHLEARAADELFEGLVPLRADPPVLGVGPGALPPISAWRSAPPGLDELARRVRPAVVRITTDADGGSAGGTGVLVDADGHAVTNAHVVDHGDELDVRLDTGELVAGRVVHRDEANDLAVVAVQADGLRYVQVADWSTVAQGDPVFTLGFPQLLEGEPTLSRGMVSALDRLLTVEHGRPMRTFQHDAPTVGGASGSPIFDLTGAVVGVHVAGDPGAAHIRFGIPADEVQRVLADLRRGSDEAGSGASGRPVEVTPAAPLHVSAGDDAVQEVASFLGALQPEGEQRLSHLHWREQPSINRVEVALVDEVITSGHRSPPALDFGLAYRRQVSRLELACVGDAEDLVWVGGVVGGEEDDEGDDAGGGTAGGDRTPPPSRGPVQL